VVNTALHFYEAIHMITLYHKPKTRSSRFIFLLEELGASYQLQLVTTKNGDGTGAVDPSNPHPHGKVPAISHNGATIFESPAIALYLTDAFPKNQIGPLVGDPLRGAYLSWLSYYTGVFEPAFTCKWMKVEVPVGTAGWVSVEDSMTFVSATLAKGTYLLGEHFSAVDVLYATTFAMFGASPLLPKDPAVDAYAKRCLERPAYLRAQAKDAGI
jgi:glutathione S-transferase